MLLKAADPGTNKQTTLGELRMKTLLTGCWACEKSSRPWDNIARIVTRKLAVC